MLWLTLSLVTALAAATQDTWIKKHFSHLGAYQMTALPLFYSLPFFMLTAIFIPRPPLDSTYYTCLLAGLPINGLALLLYMRAIRISPLSLTIPYLAFTPVFMLATGSLVLNETPNPWGITGIVFTCVGSYILNIEPGNQHIAGPIKVIFREEGSRLMLLVAFLFSLAAVIGKKGILHSSVLFFTVSFFALFALCMTVLLITLRKAPLRVLARRPFSGLAAGILLYLHAICHGYAISMVQAAYMISIKRLSILFSIIYGKIVFKETNVRIRFLGACWMLAGAVVIVMYGT
jgi:drug/metabolite transporter (DMT)-like permease